jgi:hypothetical protein
MRCAVQLSMAVSKPVGKLPRGAQCLQELSAVV